MSIVLEIGIQRIPFFDALRAFYNKSSLPNIIKYNPILFSENSINKLSCIYATISNYSSCQNKKVFNLEELSNDGDLSDVNSNYVKRLEFNDN